MESYKVHLLKLADRDIRKIDEQQIRRILDVIRSLAEDPFQTQHKKLKE